MDIRFPWNNKPAAQAPPALPADLPPAKKTRGCRPAAATRAKAQSSATVSDWVYHHLTFRGPAAIVEDFARAARGAGVVPWQLDLAALEEEVFVRAVSQPVSQRSLTVAGCRILAEQFRARVEAHHARAVGLVGRSQACPFDLQALLPVPASILQLGSTHHDALAWLRRHWGTERLRQVSTRPKPGIGRRLPAGHRVHGYGFFAYGGTPQPAVDQLAKAWPALRFVLQPRPADCGRGMAPSAAPAAASEADTISLDPQTTPRPDAVQDEKEKGSGAPLLDLDGFHGPLDQLLTLARGKDQFGRPVADGLGGTAGGGAAPGDRVVRVEGRLGGDGGVAAAAAHPAAAAGG